MKRLVLGLLILLVPGLQATEWTVIGEVPVLGVPEEISDLGDGSYLLTFRDFSDCGYFLRGILVNSSGLVTDSSMIIQPEASGSFFEPLMPTEQDFLEMRIPEGVVRLNGVGDTLWISVLDSIIGYEGSSSLVIPSTSGGCWAAFGPESGSDEWRVWRLSSSGSAEASGTFNLQGGPVNSMHDMVECMDGGLLMTGVTDSLGLQLYSVLVRLDSGCGEVWRLLDEVHFHACGDLVEIADDGSIFVAGYTGHERRDGWFMPPEGMDVFLYSLDSEGEFLMKSILHLPGQNAPMLMTLLDGGGAVLLVSSFEERSSFPGVYTLVTFSPP
jgi:hypothetical protein